MLEAAVGDGAQKFSLQQKVAETGRVDTNVATLLVGTTARDSQISFLSSISVRSSWGSSGRGRRCCLKLLVRVVDEILLVRHFDGRIG